MRDPRSHVDAAICVPATQMCGGKAEISCDVELFCSEDPRVNWSVFFNNFANNHVNIRQLPRSWDVFGLVSLILRDLDPGLEESRERRSGSPQIKYQSTQWICITINISYCLLLN